MSILPKSVPAGFVVSPDGLFIRIVKRPFLGANGRPTGVLANSVLPLTH